MRPRGDAIQALAPVNEAAQIERSRLEHCSIVSANGYHHLAASLIFKYTLVNILINYDQQLISIRLSFL